MSERRQLSRWERGRISSTRSKMLITIRVSDSRWEAWEVVLVHFLHVERQRQSRETSLEVASLRVVEV
jgi:hypothetical protein